MADSPPDPALSQTKKSPVMEIGIIGAGAIGQAFARQLLKAGYDVIIGNSRGPESLSSRVRDLGTGIRAGTVKEAAAAVMLSMTLQFAPHIRPHTCDGVGPSGTRGEAVASCAGLCHHHPWLVGCAGGVDRVAEREVRETPTGW
jgi:NAD(P)-dependent dehydrogenase (short-subunit alcohol dehydrogenase family)